MSTDPKERKRQLRSLYRAARIELTTQFRQQAADKAAQHFITHPLFSSCQHIACYLAVKEEIDALPLIQAIWQAKKVCYLPKLTDESSLVFVRYHHHDMLTANRYGILEPSTSKQTSPPHQLDLVMTPLVAFDNNGHRLGAGGGYYDRTFSFRKEQQRQKPLLIGLAFSIQQAEVLPEDSWDVKLDGVVTELGLTLF